MRIYVIAMLSLFLSVGVLAQNSANYSAIVKQAKMLAAKDLRDPDSARFRNLGVYRWTTGKGGIAVCGDINGKNSFGGYVGYRGFVVYGGVAVIEEPDGSGTYPIVGPAVCRELVTAVK